MKWDIVVFILAMIGLGIVAATHIDTDIPNPTDTASRLLYGTT